MSKQESSAKKSTNRLKSLLRLTTFGFYILMISSCAQIPGAFSGDGETDTLSTCPGGNGTGLAGHCRADSEASVATTAQPLPSYIQAVVDKIPQQVRDVASDVQDTIKVLSQVKDYASAAMAAAQLLGLIDTPEPPATLSQIRTELDKLGASLDWKITAVWSAQTYGQVKAAMDAAMRCRSANNCASDVAAWTANNNATAAVYALTDPDMAYFQRYNRPGVTSGAWENVIPVRPEVSAQNYVYDWRSGVPHLLNFLKDRMATMAALDPAFGVTTTTFDTEIRTYLATLKNHYDKMKSGVVCETKWDVLTYQEVCGWEYCGYTAYAATVFCADIYTGSYAQSVTFQDIACTDYQCLRPEEQAELSAATEQAREQVYSMMPLTEMKKIIDLLNFSLDKHGFTMPNDFDRNGSTDILWYHPSSGTVHVWQLDGDETIAGSMTINTTAAAALGWEIRGTGDFNRDGFIDILWHHPGSGMVHVWLLDGDSTISGSWVFDYTATAALGWEISGTGDFNHDGFIDILWYNPGSGALAAWLLDGDSTVAGGWNFNLTAKAASGWEIKGTGDFNRDGFVDILWHHPGSGMVHVWLLDGDSTVAGSWVFDMTAKGASGWEIKGTGDYNRDGFVDILWHHPGSGMVHVWLLDGDSTVAGSWVFDATATGASGWEIVPDRRGFTKNDFNRDNFPDVVERDIQSGAARVLLFDGDSTVAGSWANFDVTPSAGWNIAAIGDFNRDTYTDVLWYEPKSGSAAAWLLDGDSTVAGLMSFNATAGANSGWAIRGAGDFNRDGFTDILWHNPGSDTVGVWLLDGDATIAGSWNFDWKAGASGGWEIGGAGDFNRDGFVDILWHNPVAGTVAVWLLDGDSTVAGSWNFNATATVVTGWGIKGTGDFNRDGYTDILWYNPGGGIGGTAAGTFGVWLLDGDSTIAGSWNFDLTTPGWEPSSR